MKYSYFDRDISWLSFNERVLLEAAREDVPVLERVNFLSIYSSNLDEFYRVRIPSLMALQKIKKEKKREYAAAILDEATGIIKRQLGMFGKLLTGHILPALTDAGIRFVYNEPIPADIAPAVQNYFYSQLLAFLQPCPLSDKSDLFAVNNSLYLAVQTEKDGAEQNYLVNIPSATLPRFFTTTSGDTQYVVFIDDILRAYIPSLFRGETVIGSWSFKVTRDAELDLQDEFEGDLAEKIERQIAKRDLGFATRLLYSPGMPASVLDQLVSTFSLHKASIMEGGTYHNLKDLASIPVKNKDLSYPAWPSKNKTITVPGSLLTSIEQKDIIIHPPYQDYSLVLRFFNEAATDPHVEEIYVTLYRMAGDSRIATALITAARNGKQVTVFVELKARFDEANNIRWSKKMKEAGIRIIYSIPGLKVHAKVALAKKRVGGRTGYYGLLATGNFNESTARFYTDHILMTAHKEILRELELLFIFLAKRKKPEHHTDIGFQHLLVAQFNLPDRFKALIDREVEHVRAGRQGQITIKLNNLEETGMIDKLYEASMAGVKITMLVRTICRLKPNVIPFSENIRITRIVDRYLEHGRIFWFHNNGQDEIFAGSSDWMDRNIHRRIEVCFPVYDEQARNQLKELISLQLEDTARAAYIDETLSNVPVQPGGRLLRSQESIWQTVQQYE